MKIKVESGVAKVLAYVLTIALTFIAPIVTLGNQYESNDIAFYITEENIHELWDNLFDEAYDDHEFKFTEEAVNIFWQRLYDDSLEYIETLTEEEWAEIEREFEEQQQADQYFLDNFSPELLWEHYVEENPQVLRMRGEQVEEVKERINEVYEIIISMGLNILPSGAYMDIDPFVYDFVGGSVAAWTRHFSDQDGLGAAARTGIIADGAVASTRSQRQYPNDGMRRDAYRHYSWNYLGVTNPTVGATLNTRQANTRIFTTNRELASLIIRQNPSLNVTSINATQQTQGRQIRQNVLNMNRASWHALTNASNATRDDLMDLWNNHWGRVDGANQGLGVHNLHSDFVRRWNNTAPTSGLQRTNTSMTVARRNYLWDNNMHRPN